jgi:hypothetical protein
MLWKGKLTYSKVGGFIQSLSQKRVGVKALSLRA